MEEIEKLASEIKSKKYKRLLLQAPEGLRGTAEGIASTLEKETGSEIIISGEPCYGACDLPLEAARDISADAIIHLGHEDFGVKSKIPVIYIPLEYDLEIPQEVIDELKKLEETKVAIFSSVQFKKALDTLEKILKSSGKAVLIKKIILGCSEVKSSAEINIFIGSGKFHAKALRGKVYSIDLEKGKLVDLTSEIKKEEMKKFARLEKLKNAESIGIIVSKKPGQFYPEFECLKEKLDGEGKSARVLIFEEITNDKLMGLKYDAYINTACPRILDNHFDKPVINLRDIPI